MYLHLIPEGWGPAPASHRILWANHLASSRTRPNNGSSWCKHRTCLSGYQNKRQWLSRNPTDIHKKKIPQQIMFDLAKLPCIHQAQRGQERMSPHGCDPPVQSCLNWTKAPGHHHTNEAVFLFLPDFFVLSFIVAFQSFIQQDVQRQISIGVMGRGEVCDAACWNSKAAQHCEGNTEKRRVLEKKHKAWEHRLPNGSTPAFAFASHWGNLAMC